MKLAPPAQAPLINSDEPPPYVTVGLWASRAHRGGINCSIYSTLSHAAGQTGLQTPHHKLLCRICWGLTRLCRQKTKSYILVN